MDPEVVPNLAELQRYADSARFWELQTRRLARSFMSLATDYESRTGIAATTAAGHHGASWRELLEWSS